MDDTLFEGITRRTITCNHCDDGNVVEETEYAMRSLYIPINQNNNTEDVDRIIQVIFLYKTNFSLSNRMFFLIV